MVDSHALWHLAGIFALACNERFADGDNLHKVVAGTVVLPPCVCATCIGGAN